MVSISDMPSLNFWVTLQKIIVHEKDKIPEEFRIGDRCFALLANNGGNLFTRHTKS